MSPEFQDIQIITKGSHIKGEVKLKGLTHLHGFIEGNIILEEDSVLIVEESGKIQGSFTGGDLQIKGLFEGTISSYATVSLSSSANVSGKISSKNLSVSPGAKLKLAIDSKN